MITYNNGVINFGQFPNGEINIKKSHFGDELANVVTLKYEGDQDLFRLLLVKQYLDSAKIDAILRITYFPYSRMDRDSDTYAFTLKSVAKFINDMNWHRVIIFEPHSDVTPALLNNVQVVNVTEQLVSRFIAIENYQPFYPDAGAQKRYAKDVVTTEIDKWRASNQLVGFKHRDFATGRISGMEVIGKQVSDTVVIIDDLCSKGGTFVMAAEQLKHMGFEKIILVVAHCEQTIFTGTVFLSGLIDHILTTDSILRSAQALNDKLIIISINEFR